jgi:tRNA-2-methylthio-N6-dimethylallyladenosine synthase
MAASGKDYGKYFDFSGAKVISEDDQGRTIRLNGRDIHIMSEPDYRQEKQRGKEEIHVHYENGIPDDLKHLGVGKKYLIYTYGCPYQSH